jgi:TolB-like protein/Tfp pilus assembly protein PilF
LLLPLTTTAPAGAIDSIAVLPFENQTNDTDMEYLSDGIADSIITSLSQISGLKVMSSSSVRRYKGTNADPQRVAEELGVGAVLLGRVLQPGDTLSIRVELVDTQDNTQLWGAQYSRQPDEILALQEDIAREISSKLRLQLSGEEQAQLANLGTENPEAYQDYLQGRFHSNQRTPQELERAIEYFNQAIDKDPNYAQAYSGLADSYFYQAVYSGRTVKELYQRELLAAQKALELDDTLAEAHTSMGRIRGMHGWDWSVGEEHFKRAIELNPNYADAYISYGGLLNRLGRSNEAVAERKKGLALDPLSRPMTALLGRTLLLSSRYDEAIKQLQEALEMDPTWLTPRANLVSAYWFNGMYEEAITQAEKVASLGGNQTRPVFLRQVASGNRADAMTTLENWVGLTPTGNAYRYAMLGEKDLAIDWMTTAIDERYHNITTAKVNPFFDPIRDDPRFQDLLLRMNLQP